MLVVKPIAPRENMSRNRTTEKFAVIKQFVIPFPSLGGPSHCFQYTISSFLKLFFPKKALQATF